MNVKNKKIILRVDFNSPVKKGKIIPGRRMKSHVKTVKDLRKKGASIILISHQGRKGKKDFLPLKQHAEAFSKMIRKNVRYIDSIADEKAIEAIEAMKKGDVILLENVRFLDEEISKPKNANYVRKLSEHVDLFMNDAFSVSHREHASVVGFPKRLPSTAGPNLIEELETLDKFVDHREYPTVYVLGGAKIDEDLEVAEHMLKTSRCDTVLACGVFGEILLQASGFDLGAKTDWLEKNGFAKIMTKIKKFHRKYSDRIILPVDLAIKSNGRRKEISVKELPTNAMTRDIGADTISIFKEYIEEAKIIVMKGPVGVFENRLFMKGTKNILKAVSGGKAKSLIGGGHLTEAIDRFKFKESDFTHISLGGGALITYLAGKSMPGVMVL